MDSVRISVFSGWTAAASGIVHYGSRTKGQWHMPPDVLPTLQEIRKRVIADLVDADIRHAMRHPKSRRTRFARAVRRRARRLIG
jgi:hypothetical protein